MPVLLVLLGVAGLAFWESQRRAAHPAGAASQQYQGLYAQAMATNDPVVLATAAQTLFGAGFVDLARQISAKYQQLTNNPIPGIPPAAVATAGLHSLVGARGLDPHTIRVLATAGKIRKQRQQQQRQVLTRMLQQRISRTT